MTILNYILAAFILTLSILVWHYQDAAASVRYQMEIYQSQIEEMENQATEMTARFETAHQQSLDEMKQVQNRSKEIMNTSIPPDCESAIKFGRDQAKRFTSLSR
jgi:hypothetical protein